jgi:hypothetical protein
MSIALMFIGFIEGASYHKEDESITEVLEVTKLGLYRAFTFGDLGKRLYHVVNS